MPPAVDGKGDSASRASLSMPMTVFMLSLQVMLMSTGFGIVFPIFAHRFSAEGNGVGTLSLMGGAFALSSFLCAPILGRMADRHGRMRIILLALISFMIINLLLAFVSSAAGIIVLRVFEGALTAGLMPAATAMVAALVDPCQRGRWVGYVSGAFAGGIILGPALGGLLYDGFGAKAPFFVSAALGAAAVCVVLLFLTEPARQGKKVEKRVKLSQLSASPRVLLLLLSIEFIAAGSFAFVLPQMIYFFYDELLWSTTRFGVVVGAFGVGNFAGQAALGHLSDKYGRKPLILLGLILYATLHVGMAMLTTFGPMLIFAFVSGLGMGLLTPALSAAYLDLTDRNHHALVMGYKESSIALGDVIGPLALTIISCHVLPKQIFWLAAGMVMTGITVGIVLLPSRMR